MGTTEERRLYVTWRQPEGLIVPIGLLTQRPYLDDFLYEFVYLKLAEQQDHFEPLPGFADLYRRYESRRLFPVFASRHMPRERPDYLEFVHQLNLRVETDPFEVLARSEGMRATDRIEVFAVPSESDDDELVSLFFVRGIRHVNGAADAVSQLRVGDELGLVDEPDNPVNPRAMLISSRTGDYVGYAPDYLVDTIHDLRDHDAEHLRLAVEHVNSPDSSLHMRLLCRLSAPWPRGYEPFSGPDFQPLVT